MKKFIIKGFIALTLIFSIYLIISPLYYKILVKGNNMVSENEASYFIKEGSNGLQIFRDGEWVDFSIRGVTLSEQEPGANVVAATADKNTILRWLKEISDMNVNTIKVPKIQTSSFYEALYEFNLKAENPIFIIHEIPLDEVYMYKNYDVFNGKVISQLKKDIKATVDIIHGRKISILGKANTFEFYNRDISKYVLGYSIGNEWKNSFVKLSIEANKEKTNFQGEYIQGQDLNGMEYFLAKAMDFLLSYEMKNYGEQRMISFINTMEFDPLIHNQQDSIYRETSLDIDKLQGTEKLCTPIVGSYVISNEYTDFLNAIPNDSGDIHGVLKNYLSELKAYHKKNIMISSIGYSTGRAISFEPNNNQPGYGGINEEEQGEILISALQSIYDENYVGAVLSSWQDSWGKSNTWNTKHITMSDIEGEWLDVQSTNQSTGILSFQPDMKEQSCVIDGLKSEWTKEDLISSNEELKLSAKADMNYLYLLIESENLKVLKDSFYVGIDITPKSGTKVAEGVDLLGEQPLKFDIPVDFVISLNGVNNSDVKVQSRYDIFNYYYKYYTNVLDKISKIPEKNTREFQSIYLLTRPQYFNEETGTIEPPKYFDTGNLIYGNTDSLSEDFNSIADFYSGEDFIEVRIPWLMLNMVNPLTRSILDDFYVDGLKEYKDIDSINLQLIGKSSGQEAVTVKSGELELSDIRSVKYEERLKEAYTMLKDYFKKMKEEKNYDY